MPEVASVEVNFNDKTVTVTTKPDQAVTRQAVENTLKSLGYGVASFTETKGGPAGP